MSKSCAANFAEIIDCLKTRGVVRARDLHEIGVTEADIRRLVGRGSLTRVARGVYASRRVAATPHRRLAVAALRVPVGVVCLTSALRFHGLLDVEPEHVWMALPHHAWRPRIDEIPVRFAWFSGPAASAGVETHVVEGVELRVYSVAKTVADLFKHRATIGADGAFRALREFARARPGELDDLRRYARICRVHEAVTRHDSLNLSWNRRTVASTTSKVGGSP